MTAPSPSSAEPSSWAVTWLFCIWKTCTCPGGLSSFWVLCQPCLFVCVSELSLCAILYFLAWDISFFFKSWKLGLLKQISVNLVFQGRSISIKVLFCVCVRERGFWLKYFITTLLFCCCFVLFFVLCRIQLFFAHCSKSDSGMNYMYLWCIYIYMTWAHIHFSCCTEDEWYSSRAVLGRQPPYAKWWHTAW